MTRPNQWNRRRFLGAAAAGAGGLLTLVDAAGTAAGASVPAGDDPELAVPYPLAITSVRTDAVTLNWAPISIDDVILVSGNRVVRLRGTVFEMSEDYGITYTKSFDWGQSDLRVQHLFSDGSYLFGNHKELYYTHDWKTFHRTAVLDMGGKPLESDVAFDRFSSNIYNKNRDVRVVGGKEVEVHVWGNYSIRSGVADTTNIVLWYTTDRGATVRMAYRYNDAGTLRARHVHAVDFSPTGDRKWYAQTGDFANQCHVLECTYDEVKDEWSFVVAGSTPHAHGDYKWVQMAWRMEDGQWYVYYGWDRYPGGVRKFAYPDDIGDPDKHTLVLSTPRDCCLCHMYPHTGEMVTIIVPWGGDASATCNDFWYTKDGETWHLIRGEFPAEYAARTSFPTWVTEVSPLGISPFRINPISATGEPANRGALTLSFDSRVRGQGFPEAFPASVAVSHGCRYDLQWRERGGDTVPVTDIGNEDMPYTLTGLSPDSEYEYRVRATANGETSGWSDWTAFRTRAPDG
ncbi:MAG: fibronectin type III domain-containing protein [Thermoguttaceae bacterium]|jgi:hypothetical protein|nr:fibronectin type III domain-containing protein [Thermoguttaceae bacterium]